MLVVGAVLLGVFALIAIFWTTFRPPPPAPVFAAPPPEFLRPEPDFEAPATEPLPEEPLSVVEPVVPESVDRLLEGLELGYAEFEAPEQMNRFDIRQVSLGVIHSEASDEIAALIDKIGAIEGQQIRLGKRMRAKLSGTMFEIESVTLDVQAVTRSERTEWIWLIHPRDEGTYPLHVSLAVLLDVEGRDTPRTIRTFDETVKVKVTPQQWLGRFWTNNWQWLWAAVLVPLSVWTWKKYKTSAGPRVK